MSRRRSSPGLDAPGLCLAWVLAWALAPGPLAADEPLYVKNLGPVTGLLGLPSQRSASTPGAGQFRAALHTSLASHYVNEVEAPEGVNLDGETTRLALELRYGLGERWDVQLEVPWLQHEGGSLDSLIESWHDFFGMSDGGRSDVPEDLLDYRYLGPEAAFLLEDETSGLGDITLSGNYAFYRQGGTAVSLGLGYKFASGDEADLLGSGSDDAYLAVRFSGDHLSDLPLRWHGQLGYLRAGEIEPLREIAERDLWFAGLSLDWAAWETVSLLFQVDGHSAPTGSSLTVLGDDAWMVSAGLRWRFARRWAVELNFIEDAAVETAPDITFQASLRFLGELGSGAGYR